MEEGFNLLEQKVQRAAELVKRLRRENEGLKEDLERAKARSVEAEKRHAALEKELHAQAERPPSEELTQELKALRHQRDEVKKRIQRLLDVLESLDGGETA